MDEPHEVEVDEHDRHEAALHAVLNIVSETTESEPTDAIALALLQITAAKLCWRELSDAHRTRYAAFLRACADLVDTPFSAMPTPKLDRGISRMVVRFNAYAIHQPEFVERMPDGAAN